MVDHVRLMLVTLGVPSWFSSYTYDPVLRHVQALHADPQANGQVITAGHSLGGALSAAIGGLVGVPAVTMSPPGLKYTQVRFRDPDTGAILHSRGLRRYHTVVIPEYDQVPHFDVNVGNVQQIECRAGLASACHSSLGTICELAAACPFSRPRDWSGCARFSPDFPELGCSEEQRQQGCGAEAGVEFEADVEFDAAPAPGGSRARGPPGASGGQRGPGDRSGH